MIENAKIELTKIQKLTDKSEELRAKEGQREEYFKIKSQLQVKNAQIERERLKLEKQINYWMSKK